MQTMLRNAAIAAAMMALAAPAAAQQAQGQQAPANQPAQGQQAQGQQAQGQQSQGQQAPGRPAQRQYVSNKPVFSASLNLGGTGSFTGVLDPETNRLCYILNAGAVPQPTAAHIHVGGAGESGPPVLPLQTPANGSAGECVTMEADVVQAMMANPRGYYLNIHNAAFPNGAARAQLRLQRPTASAAAG